MNNMLKAIEPKTDQLNSDSLIGKTMTIKITKVSIKEDGEQPVSIFFDGDDGKPYKPCKSMCRVLVDAWGADANKYVGRSMTLYRDEKVTWGGLAVGGIRISHLSDIPESKTIVLTATKQTRKPFTIKPLIVEDNSALIEAGKNAATQGLEVFTTWGKGLTPEEREKVKSRLSEWTKQAKAVVSQPVVSQEDVI